MAEKDDWMPVGVSLPKEAQEAVDTANDASAFLTPFAAGVAWGNTPEEDDWAPVPVASFAEAIKGDNGVKDRGSILPTGRNAETGELEWAWPEMLRSAARGALAFQNPAESGNEPGVEEDIFNAASFFASPLRFPGKGARLTGGTGSGPARPPGGGGGSFHADPPYEGPSYAPKPKPPPAPNDWTPVGGGVEAGPNPVVPTAAKKPFAVRPDVIDLDENGNPIRMNLPAVRQPKAPSPPPSEMVNLEPDHMGIFGFGKKGTSLAEAVPDGKPLSGEQVGVGTDLKRMIDIFGPKMYGSDMPQVTAKELLQNSFDAVKSAYQRGDIKPGEGNVDIKLNKEDRTLAFTDNGAGMTPETVKNAFLTIAGTSKDALEAGDRSGGFGIAKMAFIFGNEGLKLRTVRDGIMTSLDTTSRELLDGKTQLKTSKTSLPNGTHIEVKIPKTFKNANGEEQEIRLPYNGAHDFEIMRKPLIGDINVNARTLDPKGYYDKDITKSVPIGRNIKNLPPKISTAHYPWGEIDVHLRPKSVESYGPAHEVLSSGLHQFENAIMKAGKFERLPYDIVLNVRPKVDASDTYYPFNNQREGFSGKVKDDINQLEAAIKKQYSAEQAQKLGNTFVNVQSMPITRSGRGVSDEIPFREMGLQNKMPQNVGQFVLPKELHIKEGKTYINNKDVDMAAELEQAAELSHEKFSLDPNDVFSSNPLFHSNLGVDVIAEAEAKYGIPAADSRHFFASIGTVVQDFRNALAEVVDVMNGEKPFDKWTKAGHPVGISLDKGYHGVHIKVPYNGFFLNPLSVNLKSDGAIARSYMHTLIHEGVHTHVSGHTESFTSGLAKLEGELEEAHPGLRMRFEDRMSRIIRDRRDAFDALRKVYNDESTRNIGEDAKGIERQAIEAGGPSGLSGRALSVREEPRVGTGVRGRSGRDAEAGGGGSNVRGPDEFVDYSEAGGEGGNGPPRDTSPEGHDFAPPPEEPGALFRWIRGQEDDLTRLRGSNEADRTEAMNYIKSLPETLKDPALNEKLYRAIEDPEGTPLAPEEQALHDTYILPIRQEANEIFNRLRKAGVDIGMDGYVHRIVKGKGTMYDPAEGPPAADPFAGGRGLGQKTSSQHGRKMWMAEGVDGTKVIVNGDFKPGDTFTAKSGEKFTIRQATTHEIEEGSEVRYFKNALVNSLDNLLRLRRVERNINYLEALKTDPQFYSLAQPIGSQQRPPPNWKQTKVPQLRGWLMEPRIANMLDAFYEVGPQNFFDRGLARVNNALTSAIFVNPISALFGHGANVAAHWYVGRGWDNFNPVTVPKQIVNGFRALRDVWKMSPRYQQMLREGNALLYAPTMNRDFHKLMIKTMGGEIRKDPRTWGEIAKIAGTSPKYLYDALSNVSSKGLWFANDVFMLQRVYDLMDKGKPVRAAIEEAEHEIPNYRIPVEAWDSDAGRAFSEVMRNKNIFIFSRYRYGAIHAYAKSIRDFVGKNVALKDRGKAAGQMLALGVLFGIIYPWGDDAAKKLTGNKNAYLRRAGPTTVADSIEKWASGDVRDVASGAKNAQTAISGFFGWAPATDASIELINNMDSFTSKRIYNPTGSASEIAQELALYAATRPFPLQQGVEVAEGRKDMREITASWIAIHSPTTKAINLRRHYAIQDDRANKKAFAKKKRELKKAGSRIYKRVFGEE